MKIVADRDIPFLKGVLEPFAEMVYLRGDEISAADVRNADALLTRTRTLCNATLLAESRVRFVGTATIGHDHIDTEWCSAQGISVAPAAGCNARGVLQWVSAALAFLKIQPSETTLGVVGVGNVGSLAAKYAASWGFRVMCSDPLRERTEGLGADEGFYHLNEIVSQADIITFHVPLTVSGKDATQNLVNHALIAALKPGAVIINSSRGPVIDPAALREWALAYSPTKFIIDTWNNEPDIDRDVLARATLGTHHIAGYSEQGKATGTAMIVNALSRKFGLPLHDWFPPEGRRSDPRDISWPEMCATMPSYFDISAENAALKSAPARFEAMRDNYNYRIEYF